MEGAYSFAAMHTFFRSGDQKAFSVDTWKDAMEAIRMEKADFAVLPIDQNSTAGIVQDIYDLLTEYDHVIVGEQIIPCEHVLMGLPGTSLSHIHTVYSHPQALMQCREFLEKHRDWQQMEWNNTAAAAKKVADEKNPAQAAIASRYAAEHFGLAVLEEGIYSNVNNSTRFIIVTRGENLLPGCPVRSVSAMNFPMRAEVCITASPHFIYNGLNMTKIESRPIMERNWEYRFFVDFEGNLSDSAVKNALRGLKSEARNLRVHGNY